MRESENHVCKKVAGYVRVSTYEQADKGTSIHGQRKAITQECKKRGWQLIEIYCDEGVSGKISERQGLQRLRHDVHNGRFEVVMFTKSDRLTRSVRDLCNLWHEWVESGIEMICVEQPEINSKGIYGSLMRNLLGIFAEWEREIILERTTKGRWERWQKKEAVIGKLPYGYELDKRNSRIVVNFEKISICKRIFAMYFKQRLSTRDIAVQLISDSVPTPRGSSTRWHAATVYDILKNPAYSGKAIVNVYKYTTHLSSTGQQHSLKLKEKKDKTKWITLDFPAIISRSRHREICELLKINRRIFTRVSVRYENRILLDNIELVCGMCGAKIRAFTATKNFNDKVYYDTYYRCYWSKASQKELTTMNRNRCSMRVRSEILDNIALALIMEYLDSMIVLAREKVNDLNYEKVADNIRDIKTYYNRQNVIRVRRRYEGKMENQLDDEERNEYITLRLEYKYIRNNKVQRTKTEVNLHDLHGLTGEILDRISAMSFEQKRSILESIIAPQARGKCVLKWNAASDSFNQRISTEENNDNPQLHPSSNTLIVEISFEHNPERLQALILGLNKLN
jgi:site-specific DNA recombinase